MDMKDLHTFERELSHALFLLYETSILARFRLAKLEEVKYLNKRINSLKEEVFSEAEK